MRPAEPIRGRPARDSGLLTVFVHGYNTNEYVAEFNGIRMVQKIAQLTAKPIKGCVVFLWPGDSDGSLLFSSPLYFKRVQTAIDAGVELAEFLRAQSFDRPGLQVQFVGHSLGCRVVLSAATELTERPPRVPVVRMLLMGAAVPEGDCTGAGMWSERLATPTFGSQPRPRREVVLHSRDDEVLRRSFPAGERMARRFGSISSLPPYDAVGFTGGPQGRWSGRSAPLPLRHGQYLTENAALRHVAEMFGPLRERPEEERKPSSRWLPQQHLDWRTLGSKLRMW